MSEVLLRAAGPSDDAAIAAIHVPDLHDDLEATLLVAAIVPSEAEVWVAVLYEWRGEA